MHSTHSLFHKHSIALAAVAALTSTGALALDLAQSPPGKLNPYVAPNVIITIDDSGSMNYAIALRANGDPRSGSFRTGPGFTEPKPNGTWELTARRISVLKYTVKKVFSNKTLLPNHGEGRSIRFAWQAMHNNGRSDGADTVDRTDFKKNSMRYLDEAHRKNFLDFIDKLDAISGTPTHKVMAQAHHYMSKSAESFNDKKYSPWAYKPGEQAEPFLGCRRSYHILMSDGGWQTSPARNQKPGNADGRTSFTLPDGTIYNKVKPYADDHRDMVADWAFESWATNLQPSLYNKDDKTKQISLTSEYRKAPPEENFGKDKDGKDAILEKYWNPRYDPANWPHLSTYTIGFSKAATTWPLEPDIKRPPNTHIVPFSYDASYNGSLPDFINGKISWPQLSISTESAKNPLDLWHSALNGRGRFYAVEKAEDLEKAFVDIIGAINAENESSVGSLAANGFSNYDKDVNTYSTFYDPKEMWKGYIKSSKLTKDNTYEDAWGGKTTADFLDELASHESRNILTWNDDTKKGSAFQWDKIGSSQRENLHKKSNGSTDSQGSDRLLYIRGDRSNEASKNSTIGFRNRTSRQGDIINSNVWYVGTPVSNYSLPGYTKFVRQNTVDQRPPMIYVGGNDGMLHGFAANDGTEKIAYVPRAVYPNLARLTWPSFDDNHRYFVDGSPMTGDINIGTSETPNWRTMLLGTLGAGGKGYFVLDVTDPRSFEEKNSENIVVMDKSMHANEPNCQGKACLNIEEADIGHIFSTPTLDDTNPLRATQISLLNNDRWAAIMGNGYNSKNERPVLLIQYLDGNKELLRIPATAPTLTACTAEDLQKAKNHENPCHNVTENGLSAPRLVDINGDGKPDFVYAGDLKGNIWKFEIGEKDPRKWGVAFDGKPLYTALGGTPGSPDARTIRQPITAAPSVKANDRSYIVGSGSSATTKMVGGMMIAFGTGGNITTVDPENTNVQTIYSVLDNTRYVIKHDASTKTNYVVSHNGNSALSIPTPEPAGIGVSKLAKKQINSTEYKGESSSKDFVFWKMADTTKVDWSTQKGWYMDLPQTGERLLKNITPYDGSNILAIYSQVPAKGSRTKSDAESCEQTAVDEERQYLTLINIMDGERPSVQLLDQNGDGSYDLALDNYVSRAQVAKGGHIQVTGKNKVTDIGNSGTTNGGTLELARMPEQSMRPSWRQLQ